MRGRTMASRRPYSGCAPAAMRRTAGAALALCLLLALTPAGATPTPAQKETARHLMQVGDGRYQQGEYESALQAYLGADEIMGVPTTSLAVGRAHLALGQLVEAVDAFGRARRHPTRRGEPAAFVAARREATRLDAETAHRIPTLRIRLDGPPAGAKATLVIDGAALEGLGLEAPHRLNPGRHQISATAAGFHPAEATVEVSEGEKKVLALELKRLSSAEPSSVRAEGGPAPQAVPASGDEGSLAPITWTAFSVGGAGLIVGAIAGGLSLSKTSALEERCPSGSCPTDLADEGATAMTLANVSNVGFAVAAAGLGVGLVTLLIDLDDDDERAAVKPLLGPGYLGIFTSF